MWFVIFLWGYKIGYKLFPTDCFAYLNWFNIVCGFLVFISTDDTSLLLVPIRFLHDPPHKINIPRIGIRIRMGNIQLIPSKFPINRKTQRIVIFHRILPLNLPSIILNILPIPIPPYFRFLTICIKRRYPVIFINRVYSRSHTVIEERIVFGEIYDIECVIYIWLDSLYREEEPLSAAFGVYVVV